MQFTDFPVTLDNYHRQHDWIRKRIFWKTSVYIRVVHIDFVLLADWAHILIRGYDPLPIHNFISPFAMLHYNPHPLIVLLRSPTVIASLGQTNVPPRHDKDTLILFPSPACYANANRS